MKSIAEYYFNDGIAAIFVIKNSYIFVSKNGIRKN